MPFDEINAVFYTQSPVQIQMVFQMAKVSFNAIGDSGYFIIVHVMERIW